MMTAEVVAQCPLGSPSQTSLTRSPVGAMEPVHPSTGEPFTALERVLWRFRMAGHEATVILRGLNNVEDVAKDVNNDLMFALTNQALIIVSKFREVWDDFGSLAKVDDRVIPVRRSLQPLVSRIDVWKGLKTYRNTTLAHAYLDKQHRLLPPTALIRAGAVPSFHAEILLLLKLVFFGTAGVLQVFEDEYSAISSTTRDQPGFVLERGPGIELGSEIDSALGEIASAVDRSFQDEFGERLGGQVFAAFGEAFNRASRE